jgi:outer membrane protein insertion porin family
MFGITVWRPGHSARTLGRPAALLLALLSSLVALPHALAQDAQPPEVTPAEVTPAPAEVAPPDDADQTWSAQQPATRPEIGDPGEPDTSWDAYDPEPALEADDSAAAAVPEAPESSFGPLLVIEAIEVHGNSSTAERLIRRALPLAPGDALRAGDPRFQQARFKILATGFFRDVVLRLRKGSRHSRVILVVEVTERGTIVLDNLYFGTSASSPWWAGLQLSERNFLGTGLGLGGGLVYAGQGDIEGADAQWAVRLRVFDGSLLGSVIGAWGGLVYNQVSEPYRVAGATASTAPTDFRSFPYSRTGAVGGLTADITPLANLAIGIRAEWVDAEVPAAPTRSLPDGSVVAVDIGLEPGRSRVVTTSLTFDRDTRTDPVLPVSGDRVMLVGEFGATWMGGSYNYAVALARYQRWWPLPGRGHVLSVHLTGGLVLGEAPRFDRLHASDFNRLLPPRALGLLLATKASPDLLGTEADESNYGEVGGSATVEYSYQLFRGRFNVYGGDLFIGAGLWALADRRDLSVRQGSLYRALPVGLMLDAGLRVDTQIGIFELTFANALGRLPL